MISTRKKILRFTTVKESCDYTNSQINGGETESFFIFLPFARQFAFSQLSREHKKE